MAKDYSLRFRALTERELPPDSRLLIPPGGPDLVILITWKLNNVDPARPNKRSRMIRIVISEEALEDYGSGSEGVRLAADERFTNWLQRKLAAFDPHHDAPLGVEPTPATWTLTTLELIP